MAAVLAIVSCAPGASGSLCRSPDGPLQCREKWRDATAAAYATSSLTLQTSPLRSPTAPLGVHTSRIGVQWVRFVAKSS